MTPRQPIGAGRQPQRPHMRRHMGAIGQKRHGVIGKATGDLHAHEDGGNNRGPFGAGFGAGMALTQKHMVAGPDAMVVWLLGIMTVLMAMMMVMAVMIVVMVMGMTMRMIVTAQGVIVRHGLKSSALPL